MKHLSTLAVPRSLTRTTFKTPLGTAALFGLALMLAACSSLIAPYNETSYRYATALKPEAMRLMGSATEDYADHAVEVDALMLKVEQAYEYVAGLPNNDESAGQWKILKDPDGNLLGGFMRRWKEEGQLSDVFVEFARDDNVGPAFDAIIALEALKIKQ